MKIGSLVELIDNNGLFAPYIGDKLPVKNKIYTVRDIQDDDALVLEEIVNPIHQYSNGYHELYFLIKRFCELMPPMAISIEEIRHELV